MFRGLITYLPVPITCTGAVYSGCPFLPEGIFIPGCIFSNTYEEDFDFDFDEELVFVVEDMDFDEDDFDDGDDADEDCDD